MSVIRMNRTDGTSSWWVNGRAAPVDKSEIWTPERVALLRKRWGKISASKIAAELGCFKHCRDGGKNAVIGKADRIGLPKTKGTPKKRAPWTPQRCAELRALWFSHGETVEGIMTTLNATRDSVTKQAIRMGLPSRRELQTKRALQVRRYNPNST